MTSTASAATPSVRPLLAAKAQVPPLRADLVARERLMTRLRGTGACRLTVVVAPAGWGKTTLLGQWAKGVGKERSVAWVSLDEADDEPVRFWTYALTALQGVAPGITAGALRALGAPGVDPVDVALPTLLNSLAATEQRLALVLDDYHVLTNAVIHEQVEFLLTYLPDALHIVLAGRSDPPLPLARLRVSGQVMEVRATDLRFTAAEAAELLNRAHVVLDTQTVSDVLRRTEGWAAGLHLAALSLSEATDPMRRAGAIRGDERHLLDYFTAEVLNRANDEQRDLLVRGSVLDRLCGPLCDAVLQREGCAAILVDIERDNLFVSPLDHHREWFRCHGLFRDALRRQLDLQSPDQVRPLLRRAADWFLGQEDPEGAIRLRLTAGDDEGAASLLPSSLDWFVARGSVRTYLQLGEQVPDTVARANPQLCVSLAWAAAYSGQVERVRPWLEAGEPLINDDSTPIDGWHSLRGAALTIRATSGYHGTADSSAALADAEHAVASETDPVMGGYVVARLALGEVLRSTGQPDKAVAVLNDAWHKLASCDVPAILRLQAAGSLASAWLDIGRTEQARRVCEAVRAAGQSLEEGWGQAAVALTLLRTAEGRIAYVDGDIAGARTALTKAVSLARIGGAGSHLIVALTALAQAELAGGDPTAARATLAEAHDTAEADAAQPSILRELRAVEARMGPVDAAVRSGSFLHTEELTERELSILRALQGQLSQREIGAQLFISLNTVKGYTKSLYRKLGASSRQEAVERGRGFGLI